LQDRRLAVFAIAVDSIFLAIPAPTTFADTDVTRKNTGVIVTRDQNQWSMPVFTSISSTNLGVRLAIQTKDIILIFRDRETIARLLEKGYLEFGVNLTVSEGPAGGIADLSTIDAEVLAYRRTSGPMLAICLSQEVILQSNRMLLWHTIQNQARDQCTDIIQMKVKSLSKTCFTTTNVSESEIFRPVP
jgi:lipid-binding SYLF domain-containing protein